MTYLWDYKARALNFEGAEKSQRKEYCFVILFIVSLLPGDFCIAEEEQCTSFL